MTFEMTMNTTEQDYELLSQYLDDELPPAAARQLEQRLSAEPRLQDLLGRLQSVQRRLQETYGQASIGPVPASVTALLQDSPVQGANAANTAHMPSNVVALPRKRTPAWGFALAASLVVAASATLVSQWNQQSGAPGVDSALSIALENTPSRGTGWEALGDGRMVRPVLSFQSSTGSWCREYLVADGDSGWHGVACRGDSGWTTMVVAAAQITDSPAEYRPAGATDSTAVADFIDGNAAGIPLDASEEAQLMADAWQ